MKLQTAIKIAIECIESECQKFAVDANFHDLLKIDEPAFVRASKHRARLREAIEALKQSGEVKG